MINPISILLKKHYSNTFKNYGSKAKGVDWRDSLTADIRYLKMQNLFKSISDRIMILDVGCGYGGFLEYIENISMEVQYTGIDIVPEMVEVAQKKHLNSVFICKDFLEQQFLNDFDYVICNGVLTQKLQASSLDMELYLKKIVKKMFGLSKIGCAFNVMTTRSNFFAPNLFYCSPSEILSYCLSEITPNVKLDHSYGLHEYTIYLYKI